MSNQLEKLVKTLADIVAKPLNSSLSPEIIMVHSRGMERWISLKLAEYNGICANTIFPFPNNWLQTLNGLIDPNNSETAIFEPDFMTFAVMGLLPLCCTQKEGFEDIKRYLANDAYDLKRYQLSQKISETFDQYLTFRPEMILAWERGEGNNWQAQLWREISKGYEHLHRAGLRKAFLDKLAENSIPVERLPQRLSAFGTSYMPLFHLELLVKISDYIDVHLLLMNPCREYWSDIVTEKEIQKIKRRYDGGEFSEGDLFLEKGNPLLSSLGTMGRDFFSTINAIEGHITELFCEPDYEETDTLSAIQSDIFHLSDRTAGNCADSIKTKTGESHYAPTILIQNCHSPMREIEVLHDHLLLFFEEDSGLRPSDIIVMTPDIESYAPFISAVFEGQTDNYHKIPFTIADQSISKTSRLLKGFMSILDLADSRFGTTQVMSVLDATGVKERFEINDRELFFIEKWVRDTRIRWGLNADHRKNMGFPGYNENTWDAGFKRLLLGYAMPGEDNHIFSGILPYDIEGDDRIILGKFVEFTDQLFTVSKDLSRARTLDDWSLLLKDILAGFFYDNEDTSFERQMLLKTFDKLAALLEISGFREKIGLPVIKYFLEHSFGRESHTGGFIAGGVTFCAMLPLRSIPAKIICLVGMNGDAFPRDFHAPGFDLLTANPRPGDRIRRTDDKYLFLQALVSARKKLYISYVGQSNRDNSRMPPSVVVSDLLDYICKGFNIDERDVVTHHRLQPFSSEYFKQEGPLFSYSKENFDACKSAQERDHEQIRLIEFISESLSEPEPEFFNVDIGLLYLFFSNPSKFLLQQRLSIFFDDELPGFENEEPFQLNGLELYQVEQELVKSGFEGKDPEGIYHLQQAMGRLPHGTMGKIVISGIVPKIDRFLQSVAFHEGQNDAEKVDVDLKLNNFILTGQIDKVYPDKLLKLIYAGNNPKYLLAAWIDHLVLSNCLGEKDQRPTVLLLKDTSWYFAPVENPRDSLLGLLSFYLKGLTKPLVFFPRSSFEYAEKVLVKGKNYLEALASAKTKWLGYGKGYSENQDPYFQKCFSKIKTDDLFGMKEFHQNALGIYGPLLEHVDILEDHVLK